MFFSCTACGCYFREGFWGPCAGSRTNLPGLFLLCPMVDDGPAARVFFPGLLEAVGSMLVGLIACLPRPQLASPLSLVLYWAAMPSVVHQRLR